MAPHSRSKKCTSHPARLVTEELYASFVVAAVLPSAAVVPGSTRSPPRVGGGAIAARDADLRRRAITLPGAVDSNSPVMWDLEDGQRKMFVLTSHSGVPSRRVGTAVERLGGAAEVTLLPHPGYGVWFEAVVSDDVETWYGYYHNEWPATRCGREDRIGAAHRRGEVHR